MTSTLCWERFSLCVELSPETRVSSLKEAVTGSDGHRGWIYYLAAKVKGKGIGRQLTEAAEEWLRNRLVRKVQLLIRPTNLKVVDFYKKLDYEQQKTVVLSKWLLQ